MPLFRKQIEITVEFPGDKEPTRKLKVTGKHKPEDILAKLKKKYNVNFEGRKLFYDGVELPQGESLSKNTKLIISETRIIELRKLTRQDVIRAKSIRNFKLIHKVEIEQEVDEKRVKTNGSHPHIFRVDTVQQLPLPQKPDLIKFIRESVIGNNGVIETPYGTRKITYCDYVASGRALKFIEDWIREEVLPMYANTHTDLSGTGSQVNYLREESRGIIFKTCGCSDEDEVIFAGNGTTGAINALTRILGITITDRLKELVDIRSLVPKSKIPVVFIGPYEHHSNELPWRESLADVVPIGQDENGQIDQKELESMLQKYQDRELLIGSFSAASNVTGILTKVVEVTRLLKKYGALACWDYAAAAPYIRVNMNPAEDAKIDAIFISPHKFIGGPGTSGILLIKKHIFIGSRVPNNPGGGTVTWVSKREHHYISSSLHEREEGGTPNIIGDIRCGLVFHLKSVVGPEFIHEKEDAYLQKALLQWNEHPNITILGNTKVPRLSTVSFLIRHGDYYLHQHIVCALLNDIFGVQARSGCACAGPYGQINLKINNDEASTFGALVNKYGYFGVKPGFCRVNFNYFISPEEVDFIIQSVLFVADHGWKFIPEYNFEPLSGKWIHRKNPKEVRTHLSDITFSDGYARRKSCVNLIREVTTVDESHCPKYLEEADNILQEIESKYFGAKEFPSDFEPDVLPEEFDQMRWFQLPIEVLQEMQKGKEYQNEINKIPKSSPWHCNMVCKSCSITRS